MISHSRSKAFNKGDIHMTKNKIFGIFIRCTAVMTVTAAVAACRLPETLCTQPSALADVLLLKAYASETIYQPGINRNGPGPAGDTATGQGDAADYADTGGTAQGAMSINAAVPSGCTDVAAIEVTDPIVTARDKYSYQDMETDLNRLKQKYGLNMQLKSLGTTVDERQIYEAEIGNANAQTHILITGAIHGREYITAMLTMKQLEHLLYSIENGAFDGQTVKGWLNEVCVHFIPMINPDGVSISQFGLNGLKSESLKEKVTEAYANDTAMGRTTLEFEPYLTVWKANANGVNLNNNFYAMLENINYRTDKPSSDLYYGTPGSENETRALQALTDSRHFKAAINYHATGSVLYWGYTGNRLQEHSRDLANNIMVITGYPMMTPGTEEGSFKAYLGTRAQPVTALTVEIGKSRAPVNFAEFPTIWGQNKLVPYYTMKWAREKGK